MRSYIVVALFAFAAAFVMTPAASALAVRMDAVDQPGGRRIHLFPTPRFGGLAVFCGLLVGLLAAELIGSAGIALSQHGARSWLVIAGAAAAMLMGLVDDRRSVQPAIKLVGEVLVAAAMGAAGYRIQIHLIQGLPWLGVVVTIVWITSVMNAVNMIDGLDGLAAGVCLIISLGLFSQSVYYGNGAPAVMLAALSGAILGFLPFNFRRARIFLGDSGSLLLGFLLAVTAMQGPSNDYVVAASAAPVLSLGFPLAELLLTSCRRVLRELRVVNAENSPRRYALRFIQRPRLFTADKDHIHHRLLALGASPAVAVLVLYLISAAMGAAALIVTHGASDLRFLLMLLAGLLVGIRYLGYAELRPLRNGFLLPAIDRLLGSPVRVAILFDFGCGAASIAMALVLHKGPINYAPPGPFVAAVIVAAAAIVAAQIAGLSLGGLYQHSYRDFGVGELITILKSIALAALAGLLVRWALWPRLDTSILLIDGYLIATFVLTSRLAFVILDYVFNQKGRVERVLIYGTDDRSARALRQFCEDRALAAIGAGFIHGDPGRRGLLVDGLRVYGVEEIESLVNSRAVDSVFVPAAETEGASLRAVLDRCAALGLPILRGRRFADGDGAKLSKYSESGFEAGNGRVRGRA